MITCLYCEESIDSEQEVRQMPHMTVNGVITRSIHDECFTRIVLGGVNHLRGTCTCHGGDDPPDPPHLTRRQAAIAAWTFHQTRH